VGENVIGACVVELSSEAPITIASARLLKTNDLLCDCEVARRISFSVATFQLLFQSFIIGME